MVVRCFLREIRGRRKIAEIAEQSGVAQPYISQIERGQLLPKDKWIPKLEEAYGAPIGQWYPDVVLVALETEQVEPREGAAA